MQTRDTLHHQRDLPAIFHEVSALLSRQDVVTGLVGRQNTPRRFLSKELGISVVNVLLRGCGMGLVTLLLYGEPRLGLVMLLAIIGNFCVAALAGVSVPADLCYPGRDPVMGSSVLLTALTDSVGFLLFLGIATLVLI